MDTKTFDAILADVAAGEAAYKAMQAHNVPRKAFYALVARDDETGNKYARAKQSGLEVLADEMLEIADDGEADAAATGKARLQVDTRKWLLSKLAPKKYGDKVDLTHAGPDGGPILSEVRRVIVKSGNTDA